jgi:hypothetical protein
MSRARALFVVVAIAVGAGVAWAAEHVYTEMDPSFNPASYKTYYWAKTDPMPSNDILNNRILADVDAGMLSRGWTKAPEGQAGLAVVVNVSTKPQQKLETFYTGWGGWYWGGWGPAETVVRTYLKGTLVVDLFDAKTKKLVWRGTASETVSDDPAKNAERIDKAIREMFGKKFQEE